jgi:translation initiation factor IF-3
VPPSRRFGVGTAVSGLQLRPDWGPFRASGTVVEPVTNSGGLISAEPRINERIRVPEVRLVGPNGEQVGIVRIEDALRLAAESDLDLVEVAPDAKPPVCKLMDFGKFKYESALKAREARKNQINTVIKEMKLRPKIDPHDYETKKGHVVRFLKAGDKVKITIMFRGREQSRPELGRRLLSKLAEDVAELGFVEFAPKQDGRNMIMVLGPHKKKTEAMAEARAAKEQRKADASGASNEVEHAESGELTESAEPVQPVESIEAVAPAEQAEAVVGASAQATEEQS